MNLVDRTARDVCTQVHRNRGETKYTLDPVTIMLIASVISIVLKIIIEKCEEQDIQKLSRRPTFLQRLVLRRTLKKKLGLKRFFQEGEEYQQAILQIGRSVDQEQAKGLLYEVSRKHSDRGRTQ